MRSDETLVHAPEDGNWYAEDEAAENHPESCNHQEAHDKVCDDEKASDAKYGSEKDEG